MLILFKTNIKTSIVLLLFTVGGTYLFAGNQDGIGIPDRTLILQEDTITTGVATEKMEINQEAEFIIPYQLANKTIDFQVNSDISYLRFSHFVKNESKKLFYHAWLKEQEVNMLATQTDSLRKVYINSSSDRKDTISALILKAEERSIALNDEIPVLYEKARDEENQYWHSVSSYVKDKFQEKIRLFQDSVRQAEGLQSGQTITINPKIPDTITYYKSSQNAVIKTNVTSEISYKIQIGAFRGKVPASAEKSIQKLSVLRKVENYKDEKGVTIYTTGKLKRYQEAVTLQNQVIQEGIRNATITAYQNGKKITVNEAKKLNDEL